MKPIRASEIGSYLYCRRAWWLRQQGAESTSQAEMAAGTELHRKHGRSLLAASFQRGLAWIILLLAILLFTWLGLQSLIGSL
jgi:CRISPR/Cas system-associated exonuclease Cas4 (RecB family)